MTATAQDVRAQLLQLVARHRALRAGGADTRLPEESRVATADPAVLRRAAVLILFGRLDDRPAVHASDAVPEDLDLLFVERATTLRQHAGQVAFPGGKVDPTDASVVDAALREAVEETGLDPAGVEVLGTLVDRELPVSDFLVTPVLGWWAQPSEIFVVDPEESAHVFRVPVADLLDPGNRVLTVLERDGRRFEGPAFRIGGTLIWGFTAMVVSSIFDELGWTRPWDRTREHRIRR
ncbi:CoA pyrophosphatase [Zhihengliuella sp.]|uniref:NUDIX hydrolase n=1 Tax=Zhihengliuella sp. TaxID=1954483 RepID=UPI002810AF92|nr:CoA pyrophosphatase [Zhihengliuella sp.]